jgi:hypothetical protein
MYSERRKREIISSLKTMILRNKLGQFRASRFLGWGMIASMAIVFTIAGIKGFAAETIEVEKIIEIDNLSTKVAFLKQEAVEKLKNCESNGFVEADAPIILDNNREISIGLFQYQRDTIIHYYKTLYGKEITRKQAVEIAVDEYESARLTEAILFETDKGWTNWLTCSKKLGLQKEIEFIKKLQ